MPIKSFRSSTNHSTLFILMSTSVIFATITKMVIDKIPVGGFLLADNILWSGKVVDPETADEAQTRGIIEFNDLVQNDQCVKNVILPVRDGIMVVQKVGEKNLHCLFETSG